MSRTLKCISCSGRRRLPPRTAFCMLDSFASSHRSINQSAQRYWAETHNKNITFAMSTHPIELRRLSVSGRATADPTPPEDQTVKAVTDTRDLEPISSPDSPGNGDKNPDNFPDGGWKAYSVVLGSFLGLLVDFGALNSVGAVQAYVSDHQLAGEKVSSVSWVFSIYMCLPFFLGAIVGPIFDRKGAAKLLSASTVLLFVGYLALSFSKSIVAFIFSLSLCLGTAHALAIPPLVSSLSHWFLLNRGKALGLATLGGSLGGAVWPLILQRLYSTVGFAWAIRIMGAVCVLLSLSALALVKSRFHSEPASPTAEEQSKTERITQGMRQHLDFSPFRDWRFTFLVSGVFFTEIALMSILTYLASYALAHGFTESESLMLLTILNAMGIPGRYLPGLFADRYGNLNAMILMLVGFCISILVVWYPFGDRRSGLYAFSTLVGFFSSSILSLTPLCLGSFTPVDIFGRCYGLMYTFSSTGILFGIPVGSVIIGNGSSTSYKNFTMFCGVFAVVGTFCWSVCRYLIVGFKVNTRV